VALLSLGLSTTWPPDIVVSGINRGANMGQDITYSGTVTAAPGICPSAARPSTNDSW
jgi:5'/3'-nucleotidase SurE